MPAILSLVSTFLPYLIGLLAVAAGYFTIKHKGVTEERQRQEVKQAEAVAKVTKKVEAAKAQDAAIDQKVEQQIESITTEVQPAAPSSPDKFRF